jgi:hemerythrin-like domain-containing protein
VQPTKQLKEEHTGIKVMLQIMGNISDRLESGQAVVAKHLNMIIEFIQIYIDKCHHGKEEFILFPALKETEISNDNGTIEAMLAEHTSLRNHVNQMSRDINDYKKSGGKPADTMVKNIRGYIELLNQHIDKEDTVLYPLADQHLPAMMQGELMWRFEQFEEDVIKKEEQDKLSHLVNVLIDKYSK